MGRNVKLFALPVTAGKKVVVSKDYTLDPVSKRSWFGGGLYAVVMQQEVVPVHVKELALSKRGPKPRPVDGLKNAGRCGEHQSFLCTKS